MRKNNASEKICDKNRSSGSKSDHIIPFLTGRPQRTYVIGADDIINLQIALNTSKTLEEFLLIT